MKRDGRSSDSRIDLRPRLPTRGSLSCCTHGVAICSGEQTHYQTQCKQTTELNTGQWLVPGHQRSIVLMTRKRASSPITAAGPSRILTGFPIMPERATTRLHDIVNQLSTSIPSCQVFFTSRQAFIYTDILFDRAACGGVRCGTVHWEPRQPPEQSVAVLMRPGSSAARPDSGAAIQEMARSLHNFNS
jgi:hypothetical protein